MAKVGRPIKFGIRLTPDERTRLEGMIHCGKGAINSALKARILLKADVSENGPGWSDERIAEALETSLSTVFRTRRQFVEEGLDAALSRKKSSWSPPRIFDGEAEARLIVLACSKPPQGYTRWTMQMLEKRVVELGIVEKASDTTIFRVLKKNEVKPHKKKCWVIPPKMDKAFVIAMENILKIYTLLHDPARPLVCLDETSKQLTSDKRKPVNLLSKVTLFYRPTMPPPAGRKDSWRGAAAGPARRTNHPIPFYADHPWLPFHRCPMRRSFYNPRGANLDEIFPLRGSLLHDIPHLAQHVAAHAKEVISERQLGRQWVRLKHHRDVVKGSQFVQQPKSLPQSGLYALPRSVAVVNCWSRTTAIGGTFFRFGVFNFFYPSGPSRRLFSPPNNFSKLASPDVRWGPKTLILGNITIHKIIFRKNAKVQD